MRRYIRIMKWCVCDDFFFIIFTWRGLLGNMINASSGLISVTEGEGQHHEPCIVIARVFMIASRDRCSCYFSTTGTQERHLLPVVRNGSSSRRRAGRASDPRNSSSFSSEGQGKFQVWAEKILNGFLVLPENRASKIFFFPF